MLYKVKLKNADKSVILDDDVYHFFTENHLYKSLKLLENLRLHSSGYAFFQKSWKTKDQGYKTDTYYLHKLIAEKNVEKPESDKRLFVSFQNGNPLDCRVENLYWLTMGGINRNQRPNESKVRYRGVIKEGKRYRGRIYVNKKPIDLGVFDSAEDAAEAYNAKSIELFGKTKGLNKIQRPSTAEPDMQQTA